MTASSTKFKDVDEYIGSFPPDVQKILEKLRETIHRTAPEAEEAIRYGMPTFRLNGNLVHFAAYRHHIGFYPTPTGIEAFEEELAPYKHAKGSVQFPLDKPIPYDLVKRMVKMRVKENTKAKKKQHAGGESEVLANIAAMPEPDRTMGERLHAIITANAPALSPKLWYGMPAYARDGKVVCFFQSMDKFKSRYATFGFNTEANLDEGNMWPTAFALKKLTAAEEKRIAALVKKAVS